MKILTNLSYLHEIELGVFCHLSKFMEVFCILSCWGPQVSSHLSHAISDKHLILLFVFVYLFVQDIGHAILEAYSRVLGNLAFSILSRIGDILQEDSLSNPNSPVVTSFSPAINLSETWVVSSHIRHSLIDKMNKADGRYCESSCGSTSDLELSSIDAKGGNSVTQTPSRSRVWCIGREACTSASPQNSPQWLFCFCCCFCKGCLLLYALNEKEANFQVCFIFWVVLFIETICTPIVKDSRILQQAIYNPCHILWL